jgi:hypothetical protein
VTSRVAPTLPLLSAIHGANKTLGLLVAMSTKGAYITTTRVVTYAPPANTPEAHCRAVVSEASSE